MCVHVGQDQEVERYGLQECFSAHKLNRVAEGSTGTSETTEANKTEPASGTSATTVLLGVLLFCMTALLATMLAYTYRRRVALNVVHR